MVVDFYQRIVRSVQVREVLKQQARTGRTEIRRIKPGKFQAQRIDNATRQRLTVRYHVWNTIVHVATERYCVRAVRQQRVTNLVSNAFVGAKNEEFLLYDR